MRNGVAAIVAEGRRGGGIGKALMLPQIDRARGIGKHGMVAGIEADNTGSIRLHEGRGVRPAGMLHRVGMTFGRWLDLAFLQLVPDEAPTPPDLR